MNSAGIDLSSRVVSNQVFSTRMSLTSVFGMGTGGTSLPLTPALQYISEAMLREIKRNDPYGNRTHDYAVRGRRLSLLTNGPINAPSGTRTRDPLIKSQLLYHLS